MLLILRLFLTPLAIVAIAASAVFAFRFGWSKGNTEVMRWAFAGLLCGLDLSKAVLPVLATWARQQGDHLRVAIIWLAFVILTGGSLWAALGVTAIQLAEAQSAKAAAIDARALADEAVKQRQADLAAIPQHERTTREQITAAEHAVRAADKAVEQECGKVGDNCRKRNAEATERRSELAARLRNYALTTQAIEAERRLRAAEEARAAVDVRVITQDADPQAVALAKVLGISETAVSTISFVLAALMVEIGSGLLLWMLYGHSANPEPTEPAMVLESLSGTTPVASRDEFLKVAVLPKDGGRIPASALFAAYQRHALERGLEPMSATMFGRSNPIEKQRLGGVIYYLDVELAPAYAGTRRELRVVTANQGLVDNEAEPVAT